jgi:SAM-dependent methyltransferase
MSERQIAPTEPAKNKSRLAIIRDYFIGGSGREFDTYRDPELYDKGAHSHLYRRDNLARGVADVAVAHMPHGEETKILDIGAGTGILSLELARRNHDVTALDLFAPQLQRLGKKAAEAALSGNITPVQADMNQGFPFADDSFGSVVSLRATRYINNFDNWLGEVHRVLEPGGSFVLPVFAVDTVPWKRNSEAGIHQPTTHNHVMAAIINAGFEVDEAASSRYSDAVDLSLGERDVPIYYKPNFVVAEVPTA